MIAVFFYNKTTRVPGTGLAPTVTGANLKANTLVLNSDLMTESILPGWYTHSFTPSEEINYAFDFQPNDSNFIYAFNQSFLPAKGTGGGGGSFNISGVTGSITNLSNLVKNENEKLKEFITNENNETNSHIDIVKSDIITTIEGIEQAEFVQEEKEAKKAIKLLNTLDKKVSSYIDSEMNDKEELGDISKEFTKLEMEDAKREKEKEIEHKKMMEEEDKMMDEKITTEFAKLDEKEKEDKRKELEQELQELEKEKKEIEQELKTL